MVYEARENYRQKHNDDQKKYSPLQPESPRLSAKRTPRDFYRECMDAHNDRMRWLDSLPPEARKAMEGELGFLGSF